MNKTINPFIISLLGLLFLFSNPSNIKADEVCATESLESDWKAGQICPQVCQNYKEGYIWNKIWFPFMQGKECMNQPSSRKNGANSVCQCDLQPCSCDKEGEQLSVCDENLNKLGANQCSSNCDCEYGRVCKEGWCQKGPPIITPCCNACFLSSNACNHQCGLTNVVCLGRCYAIWLICASKCPHGCFATSETKHDNESSPTEKTLLKKEPTREKEIPSASKKLEESEQKQSPEPEKSPIEKELSKPQELPNSQKHSSKP